MRALRIALLSIGIVVALLAMGDQSRLWLGRFDFRSFYCAARVLSSGSDPYRYEPLRSCEAQLTELPSNGVVPAPLPPYAIAVLLPLTKLSFARADLVWVLLIVTAAITFTFAIVDLAGLPFWLVGICAASSLLVEPVMNGALPPIPLALLALGAAMLARGRWTGAAASLGFAAIQPHLAAGPIVAAFVLIPPMRLRLALVAAIIALVSVAAGGPQLNLEYLQVVLPAHAASELGIYGQYSLSALLHVIGFSNPLALAIGSAQYAGFLVAGVILARLLHDEIPGGSILVPLTCAVTGGTFIHQTELAGALPLAFVLAARLNTRLAWAGVSLLATPWEWLFGTKLGVVAGVVAVAILRYRKVALFVAGAAGLAIAAALTLYSLYVPIHVATPSIPAIPASALADAGWYLWQRSYPPALFWLPAHALTYLGLALTYWGLWRLLIQLRAPARQSTRT